MALNTCTIDDVGNLTSASGGFKDSLTNKDSDIFLSVDYDELGRVTLKTYQSNEAAWFSGGGFITREFLYSYDWVHGTLERLGPDGETTYMETDRAGRVTYVSHGAMSAKYYYYPTGQLRLVRLGNGHLRDTSTMQHNACSAFNTTQRTPRTCCGWTTPTRLAT